MNATDLSDEDRLELQRLAVDKLPPKSRDLFLELHGHFGGDKVNDIINTNAFDIEVDSTQDSNYGVLPETSRMNHDCRPK